MAFHDITITGVVKTVYRGFEPEVMVRGVGQWSVGTVQLTRAEAQVIADNAATDLHEALQVRIKTFIAEKKWQTAKP